MFGVWFSLIICTDICLYKFKSDESARIGISTSFTLTCSIIWKVLKMALVNMSWVTSMASVSIPSGCCVDWIPAQYMENVPAWCQDAWKLAVVIIGWCVWEREREKEKEEERGIRWKEGKKVDGEKDGGSEGEIRKENGNRRTVRTGKALELSSWAVALQDVYEDH